MCVADPDAQKLEATFIVTSATSVFEVTSCQEFIPPCTLELINSRDLRFCYSTIPPGMEQYAKRLISWIRPFLFDHCEGNSGFLKFSTQIPACTRWLICGLFAPVVLGMVCLKRPVQLEVLEQSVNHKTTKLHVCLQVSIQYSSCTGHPHPAKRCSCPG